MPKLLVHLISAANLIAADSNGSGSWKKSKVVPKTLNPRWNESFVLALSDPQTDTLELRVFDRDILVDDNIGKAFVSLINLRYGAERELTVTLDGVKTGEVNVILTALDFGEKEEQGAIAVKSRDGPSLPMPASMGKPAHTHSETQLQSPPTHQPVVGPVHTASAPTVPHQPPSPPQQAAQPTHTQPVPYPQAPPPYVQPPYPQPYYPPPPPPQQYYAAPPPYAYGYPPQPQSPKAPPQPESLASSLGDFDKVKQTPVTDSFEFGKQLGKGAFAVVFEGMRKSDQELVAIKVIEKARVAGTNVKLLRREVLNLMALSHPHIMKLFDIYEDQTKFYLILELIRGKELFEKIVALGHYSEQDAAHLMEQALSAIAYLHSKGIAHRDLKPENLLSIGSGADEKIKLADFGLSKNFSEEEMSTSCGSPLYVAPEVLTGRGYTKAVDVWSLGVILYILLVGYPPFNGQNAVVLYRQIMHNEWGFGPAWTGISADARDLVLKMMTHDPARRITAEEAMQHPWIKQKTSLPKSPLQLQAELSKTMVQLQQL